MMEILIGILVLLALVALFIKFSVTIVPQGYNYVIEYFGEYQKTFKPGLNFIIPLVEKVSARVTTKDIVLDVPGQEVITKDNAVIIANAVSFITITDPSKAVYGVTNYEVAVKNLVQTTLRSIIGEMELDEALSSRELIKTKLKNGIADDIIDWGITMKNVEIQDIKPSHSMQNAMEEQAAAVRSKRAAITAAEGNKQAQILEAEGRKEAAKMDAEAQVTLSKSAQEAIENISKAVGNNELPAMFMIGEKYIKALEKFSASENGKTIILPADILGGIKGMLGKS